MPVLYRGSAVPKVKQEDTLHEAVHGPDLQLVKTTDV